MLVSYLLDIVLIYEIVATGWVIAVATLVGDLVGAIIVAYLCSNTALDMLALKRQKGHIVVDQIAVDDRGVVQPFVVLLLVVIDRVLDLGLESAQVEIVAVFDLFVVAECQLGNVFGCTIAIRFKFVKFKICLLKIISYVFSW